MRNYIAISALLSSIDGDLSINHHPAPKFSFAEWIEIRRELREMSSDLRRSEEQRDIFLKASVRAMPSLSDDS